jgi:hypothetical protein
MNKIIPISKKARKKLRLARYPALHAPILHQHKQCLQTDQNEITHDPRHLAVSSCASKMISQPVVHSAQTMHLSCNDTNNVSK